MASRVVLNRSRLDDVRGGLADGVFDLARAIVVAAETRAPYASPLPPHRKYHLDEVGGALLYVDGKRTHEYSSGTDRPKLPGRVSVRRRGGIIGIAGFGFPANFVELGTVKAHAQPFLTPSASEILGSESRIILSAAMTRRLQGLRSPNTARITAKIAAARAARKAAG